MPDTAYSSDPAMSAAYAELLRRDAFRSDPAMAAAAHELRRRGVIKDPTQGGLVAPTVAEGGLAPAPVTFAPAGARPQTPVRPPAPAPGSAPRIVATPAPPNMRSAGASPEPAAPVLPHPSLLAQAKSAVGGALSPTLPIVAPPPAAGGRGAAPAPAAGGGPSTWDKIQAFIGGKPLPPGAQPAGPDAPSPATGGYSVVGGLKNALHDAGQTVLSLGAFPVIVARTAAQDIAGRTANAMAGFEHLIGNHEAAKIYEDTSSRLRGDIIETGKALLGGDDGMIAHTAQMMGFLTSALDPKLSPEARDEALKNATALGKDFGPGIVRETYEHPVGQIMNLMMIGEAGAALAGARATRLAAAAEKARALGNTAAAAKLEKAAAGMRAFSERTRAVAHTTMSFGTNKALPAAAAALDRANAANPKYQAAKAAALRVAETPVTKAGIRNTFEDLKDARHIQEGQVAAEAARLAREIREAAKGEQRRGSAKGGGGAGAAGAGGNAVPGGGGGPGGAPAAAVAAAGGTAGAPVAGVPGAGAAGGAAGAPGALGAAPAPGAIRGAEGLNAAVKAGKKPSLTIEPELNPLPGEKGAPSPGPAGGPTPEPSPAESAAATVASTTEPAVTPEPPKPPKRTPWQATVKEIRDAGGLRTGDELQVLMDDWKRSGLSGSGTFDDPAKIAAVKDRHMPKPAAAAESATPALDRLAADIRDQRAPEEPPAGPVPEHVRAHVALADEAKGKLDAGETITGRDLTAMADRHFGGKQVEGKYDARDAYDALETAVNRHIAEAHPDLFDLPQDEALAKLKAIEDRLPTQTNRTETQEKYQQFSTPPREAYAAVKALGDLHGKTALEPSAGTGSVAGMLRLAGAAEVVANEHPAAEANLRAGLLTAQGFPVSRHDAERIDAFDQSGRQYDVVAMNPPFSSTGGRTTGKTSAIGARHVQSAAALVKPGGRLVAIVGEETKAPAIEGAVLRADIMVSGKNYRKYGTEYNNRILVYDKGPALPEGAAPIIERGPADTSGRRGSGYQGVSVEEASRLLEGLGNERGRAEGAAAAAGGGGAAARPGVPGGAAEGERPESGRPVQSGEPVGAGDSVPDDGGSGERGGAGAGVSGAAAGVRAGRGPGEPAGVGADGSAGGPGGADAGGAGPGAEAGAAGANDAAGGARVPAAVPDTEHGGGGDGIGAVPVAAAEAADRPIPAADVAKADTTPAVKDVGAKLAKTNREPLNGDQETGTFTPYVPEIGAGNPHPSVLVETGSMAGVKSPLARMTPEEVQTHIHFAPEVLKEGRLSDAQLEPVVAAQVRHTQKLPDGSARGYYVGDGTGVGKGRITAGILLNNWEQGNRRAVWLTANHKALAGAALRDLGNVGGWVTAPVEGKGGVPRIPSFTIDDFKTGKVIDRGEGVLICSYDTLGIPERLQQVTEWLRGGREGSAPVIVMDEAHKGAHAVASGRGKPSRRGGAMVKIQGALPDARVVYLSATAADSIGNLGYATRLGLWGEGTPFPSFEHFQGFISSGGIGAMEMVARELKQMGAYNARSIAFAGPDGRPIEYHETVVKPTTEMVRMYDKAADAWAELLHKMDELEKDGLISKEEKQQFGMQYWGAHQRFFKGLLTAFKAPDVIRSIEAALERGEAPVVNIDSTNEGLMLSKVAEGEAAGLDVSEVDFTNKDALRGVVERLFPTQLRQDMTNPQTGATSSTPVWRLPSGGTAVSPTAPPGAVPVIDPVRVRARDALLGDVGDLQVPGNLLDEIVLHFGHENVAELTGRKSQLVRDPKTGDVTLRTRSMPRGNGARDIIQYEQNEFQQGRRKIAIVSRAAAQGIDLHASREVANQRVRRQILAELGWQTKEEMQKLGRTHRADEVSAPVYELASIDVGGDKRFSSALAANLSQLGAIGRGDRSAAGAGELAKYDFNSDYGKRAAIAALEGMDPRDRVRMGLDDLGKVRQMDTATVLKNVFNRLLVLPIEKQNAGFAAFDAAFRDAVEAAKASGEFEHTVQDIKAVSIKPVRTQTVYTDAASGAETRYHELETELPVTRRSWKEMRAQAVADGEGALYKNSRGGLGYVTFFRPEVPAGSPAITKARIRRPNGTAPVVEFGQIGANWERVPAATEEEKAAVWDEAVRALPDTRTERVHVIEGVTLPIHNRIHGDRRVVRVPLANGERIVGLQLSENGLHQTLKDLGVLNAADVGDAKSLYTHALAALEPGETIQLAGGLGLKRKFVQGGEGLQIVDTNWGDVRDPATVARLKAMGALEIGKWGKDYFIPRDAARGPEVLEALLAEHKVVDLPKSMQPAEQKGGGSNTLGFLGSGYLSDVALPALAKKAKQFFTRDYSRAIAYDEALSDYVEAGDPAARADVLDDVRGRFGWKAGGPEEGRFVALAQKTQDFENEVGRQLVANGLISKEAFEANRDSHLRRIYAYYENPDAWMRQLEKSLTAGGMKPELVQAKMADERKLYERVTGKQPEEAPVKGAPIGRVGKKRFSERTADEDTRQFLGEIRLASSRVERGGAIAAREIAKTRLNRTVARGLGVTQARAKALRELRAEAMDKNALPPDSAFKTPGERLYFYRPDLYSFVRQEDALKGATNYHIPRQIYQELLKQDVRPGAAGRMAQQAFTWWKLGKTVLSPGSWTGNVLGNLVLSQREAMLPIWKPRRYGQAIRSMKTAATASPDRYWQLAEQVAEYPYESARMEIGRPAGPTAIPYPQTPREVVQAGAQGAMDRLTGGYASIDMAFKHALFIDAFEDAKKLGMSDLSAAREGAAAVERTYPNYRQGTPIRALRPAVQWLRRGWVPFVTWDASAVPLVARAFAEQPGRMALFPAVYRAYQGVVEESRRQTQTEKERTREDKSLPEYLRAGGYLRLPGREPDYADIAPANPVGSVLLGQSPADLAFQRMNPLISTGYEIYMNRSLLTGQPIVPEAELPAEKLKGRAAYAAKEALPSLLSYQGDKLRQAATGMSDKPIREKKPGGGTAVRAKLRPEERLELATSALARQTVKHVDVGRERRNRYYETKDLLTGTKSVLRTRILAKQARLGRKLTRAEIDALVAPYRDQLQEKYQALPR